MQLELSEDQDFFRQTTARFLTEKAPPSELRRLRHDSAGFDPDFWRQGAELGWTSLLVSEADGGGSISGDGLVDLTLVAHEFGRHAAPGPLVSTNVVAGALSAGGGHGDLLGEVMSGTSVVTWCYAEGPPNDRLGCVELSIRREGADLVLDGEKRPVESATDATHLLVTGRTGDGLTQVIVPTDTPGVTVEPMHGIDLTRRFSAVGFDGVRVPADAALGLVGKADDDVERQLQQALVLVDAEAVGTMDAAFDMTVEWAFDRHSFGQPLASYQALKHRFAQMKTWLEASHAISDEAAAAVAAGQSRGGELASAAKAYIGHHGAELVQECVQLHGGIGLTFEHDLHLFLRRLVVDRALFGTPAEHRRRIGAMAMRREDTP